MFFYSEPTPVSHVDSNLKLFLDPSSPTGSSITLYNGAAVSSSGGVDTFYLDGVNDYGKFTGSLDTISQNSFTISMWVKMAGGNSGNRVIMTNNTPNWPNQIRGMSIMENSGRIIASIEKYDGNVTGEGSIIRRTSNEREGRVDDENWHNIVMTCYGGRPGPSYAFTGHLDDVNIKLFLNKVEASGEGSNQGSPSLWYHGWPLTIGYSSNSQFSTAFSPYNGHISNILIYDRELSLAEIQQNYDAFKAKFGR